MKVILTADVKNVGKKDQIINVAEGYYRNYLVPRKLAVEAAGTPLAQWEQRRKNEAAKEAKASSEAKALAERLNDVKVTIKGKTGSGSRLYGSITAADIADAIEKQTKIKIDKRKIELSDPIKALGTFEVQIRLHRDSTAHMKAEIVAE